MYILIDFFNNYSMIPMAWKTPRWYNLQIKEYYTNWYPGKNSIKKRKD